MPNPPMSFVHPKLLDLRHSSPGVTGNGSNLIAACVLRHEGQPLPIIAASRAAIMIVQPILKALDFGRRQVVPCQDS